MKRFCMSLCILVLFNASVFAKDKAEKKFPCQKSETKASQNTKTKTRQKAIDSLLEDLPCECALIDFGSYWIGERHPFNSSCMSPEPILISGDGTSYGVCKPQNCEDGNCTNVLEKLKQSTVTKSLMTGRLPYKNDLFPVPASTQYMDPKFVKIIIGNDEIYAKVYTVAVDVKKNAEQPPHNLRGKHQVFIVGYETDDLRGKNDVGIIEQFPVLSGNDSAGRPYVDAERAIVNFGLRKGIVFLAP